jgi:hypothetical protein
VPKASLTGIGLLTLFLQKLGKAPRHQRSDSLKLLEEAFGELGRIIPRTIVFVLRSSIVISSSSSISAVAGGARIK